MKRITSYLLFLFLTFISATAQQHGTLPHQLTPQERSLMPQYLEQVRNSGNRSGITTPPASPVRTAAEWEEADALCITWTSYTQILREIVRYAKEECTVYIICSNPATVQSYLTAGGVTVDASIVFITAPYNSIWMRDYGPEAGYTNDVDSLIINDWIYNRPRPQDDVLPEVIATQAGVPMYEMTQPPYDVVHTGGNFMCDGLGTGFSSELVLQENPDKTEAQIDNIMQQFMGIDRYIKMPVLPYDGIHHIDMHMKLLDEETLLVGQYPDGISDGPQIAANIAEVVNNYQTAFGNQYKVVYVPMPPDAGGDYPSSGGDYRTFTNSIFINKTILVPIYEEQYDTTALRIYQEQLPGYNVVGIDCNAIIPASGALHCITKLVYAHDPLLIAHPRLRDTYFVEDRQVMARIQHRSGIASATLYWSTSVTDPPLPYELPMTLTDPANNIWTATIPAQPAGAVVTYYIEAAANSGKTQVRPITAPEGMYSYKVMEVTQAPTISFTASQTQVCPDVPVQFTDASTPAVTSWLWSFPGGTPATSTVANPTVTYASPGTYNATLTATNAVGSATYTMTAAVTVQSYTGVAPYTENFTGGIPAAITITNTNADAITWVLATGVPCNGSSLKITNFDNSSTGATDVVNTSIDLAGYTNASLSFDVAYAPYNTTYFDRLQVVIERCGTADVTVYDKSGTTLATAPATTSAFTPSGCSQWRTETVNLSGFEGEVIRIKFINISGYGNNLYLDNISVQATYAPPVPVKVKALLQGPFVPALGNMNTGLTAAGLLPLNQPFNRAPWNYAGSESIANAAQIPAGATDWVLVELRNGTNPNEVLAQRAAILLNNGVIRNATGSATDAVTFTGIASGSNYFISVKHRNHVPVMSATPVQLPNATAYDFTASAAAAANTGQMVQVAAGKYALWAGDFDGNGVVSVHDFNYYTPQVNPALQYADGDLNLDGQVNSNDFDIYRNNCTKIGVTPIRY